MAQSIALITTHIQMYDVMKLRDLTSSKMFSLHVNKCLVRNRCEYFTMIELFVGTVDMMCSWSRLVGIVGSTW